ncbi:L-arabinose isomerase family protein [Paenibacillus taihuensis]|nr:hypothetical protein [Paenibacillus taihuensis]
MIIRTELCDQLCDALSVYCCAMGHFAHGARTEWIKAAGVMRTMRHARFGFLGNTYSGMLDMYSDFAMVQSQLGLHIEVLKMCDLDRFLQEVTEEEVAAKLEEVYEMFEVSGDSPSDPIAPKPTEEQLDWSARVAVAQEKLVRAYDLDALTYYYHGQNGNDYEKLQSGFIVGHSLLTARGIPCSGEGDLKTAIGMKICDILGTGGSFSEIVVVDYMDKTILLGHDDRSISQSRKGSRSCGGWGSIMARREPVYPLKRR